MLSRFIHNKRGVSEIIGSLLVILIVTTAGVAVYAYSVDAFNSSSSHFQQQTRLNEERLRERLLIPRVWGDTSSNQLNVTVLNYGKIDIAINAVYINGTAVTEFLGGKGVFTGVGTLVGAKFTSPLVIQSGSVYEILVVTERGGKATVYWTA